MIDALTYTTPDSRAAGQPAHQAKNVAELAQIAAIANETTAAGNSTAVAELEKGARLADRYLKRSKWHADSQPAGEGEAGPGAGG